MKLQHPDSNKEQSIKCRCFSGTECVGLFFEVEIKPASEMILSVLRRGDLHSNPGKLLNIIMFHLGFSALSF